MAMVIDSLAVPLARQRATAPVAAALAEPLGRRLEAARRIASRAMAGLAMAARMLGEMLDHWLQGGRSAVVLDDLSAHTLRDIGLERTSLARAVHDLEQGFDPRQTREM